MLLLTLVRIYMWSIPWEINNIIVDADIDLDRFSSIRCGHIFKEANKLADFMAHEGHSYPTLLYSFPPL